jgi:hypothetical protein
MTFRKKNGGHNSINLADDASICFGFAKRQTHGYIAAICYSNRLESFPHILEIIAPDTVHAPSEAGPRSVQNCASPDSRPTSNSYLMAAFSRHLHSRNRVSDIHVCRSAPF